MKNTLFGLTILGTVLIITGAFFKIEHISGSSELLFVGIILTAFAFLSRIFKDKLSK